MTEPDSSPRGLERALAGLAGLLLAALLAALFLVPDVAYERTKLVWGRGLLLALVAVVLLRQAAARRVQARLGLFLGAAILPFAVAATWMALGDLTGQVLARDELLRLATLPLTAWVTADVLGGPGARRRFSVLLSVLALGIAGWALAENLSAVLGLPLDRETRSMAGFGNAVFLGAVLVLVTPLCMADALYAPDWRRWPAALAAGLCLPAFLATGTRSAWIGFGTALLVGILMLAPTPRHRRRLVAGMAVVALLTLPLVSGELARPVQHALIWRDTVDMVAEHPFGVGPGQFPIAFVSYASRELLETYPRGPNIVNDVHNEPLQLMAELGWPGLLATIAPLLVLAGSTRRLLQRMPPGDPERVSVVACAAALTGAVAQSFVSPDLRFGVTMILWGLVAGRLAAGSRAAGLPLPRGAFLLLAPAAFSAWIGVSTITTALRLDERALVSTPVAAAQPRLTTSQRRQLIASLYNRIHQRPDDWKLHYYLGMALGGEGNFPEAARSFRRALELQPQHIPTMRRLGESEARAREYQRAIARLTEVLDHTPDDLGARYWRAFAALQSGDLGLALADTETILSMDPDHRPARLLLEKLRE